MIEPPVVVSADAAPVKTGAEGTVVLPGIGGAVALPFMAFALNCGNLSLGLIAKTIPTYC